MTDRHTVETITSDALNALYEQLDAAEASESNRQLAVAREALASATTRAASAEAQAKHWLAFIERGLDTHMQFSVRQPDGTYEQLPCADWCHACRVQNAETAVARVRALAEANTADGADGQPCDADTLWPSEILAVLDEAGSLPAAAGPIVVDNPRDTGWFWICTKCGAEAGKFSTDDQAREFAATQHPQCPPDPEGPYAFTIPAEAKDRRCTCTGTDAGLNACSACPTPWPDIPGATRIRGRDDSRTVELPAPEFKETSSTLNSGATVLREQVRQVIHDADDHSCQDQDGVDYDKLTAAVLALILPSTRIIGTLHRCAEADINRVIDLYDRWTRAGAPPLGTLMSRWWDARLVELNEAILGPAPRNPS